MKRKLSVRTEITLAIAVSVLLTVTLLSLLANFLVDREFVEYISRDQQFQKDQLAAAVEAAYLDEEKAEPSGGGRGHHRQMMQRNGQWDVMTVQGIGTGALSNGMILSVLDTEDTTVWSMKEQNASGCRRMMSDTSSRMERHFGKSSGEVTTDYYPLSSDGKRVGTLEISYYGPYYLSDSDFEFLSAINKAVWIVGALSLLAALVVGALLARRLSRPIRNTSSAASQMAAGAYDVRIQETHTNRELDDLISSINHLASSLEQQETLRKNLTSDLAHELRTPLTTVSTHIEAMTEGVWEPTPERLGSLYEEISRITFLVQDLEDLARIENAMVDLKKESTELREILQKAVDNFDYEIKEKALETTILGEEVVAFVDQDRFYQVIYNLLSNAIKFTPEKGTVSFTLQQKKGFAYVTLEDSGTGISKEELPYIFERFYRAEKSRNRKTGGSGVGLTIAKTLVEAHGGTLTVESHVGIGTRFFIAIPLE